jgi:hypothetical protein
LPESQSGTWTVTAAPFSFSRGRDESSGKKKADGTITPSEPHRPDGPGDRGRTRARRGRGGLLVMYGVVALATMTPLLVVSGTAFFGLVVGLLPRRGAAA